MNSLGAELNDGSTQVECCRNGHVRTPENTYIRPSTGQRDCLECRRAWRAKHPGYSTDAVRKYRSDPEKRERDREASRRWKREHLGQPGRPRRAA